jgi:hypothetical protein
MSAAGHEAILIARKRHYWLRDSFAHLASLTAEVTLGGLGANGADQGHSIVYPKTTLGACRELQVRGLNASVPALNDLIRRRLVRPPRAGRNYQWFPEQIDWAAEYLDQQEEWTATTQFCRVADLEFGQVVKAYRVAAARFGLPFRVDFELQHVVAVIEPASAPTAYARVRFHRTTEDTAGSPTLADVATEARP